MKQHDRTSDNFHEEVDLGMDGEEGVEFGHSNAALMEMLAALPPSVINAAEQVGPRPSLRDALNLLRTQPSLGSDAISAVGGKAEAEKLASDPQLARSVDGGQTLLDPAGNSGGGRLLPDCIRMPLEDALGEDLGGVLVRDDTQSGEANELHGAGGMSIGQTILLPPGGMPSGPDDTERMKVLTHEVVHTVQAPQPSNSGSPLTSTPSSSFEREAEDVADRVSNGEPVGGIGRAPGEPKRFAIAIPFILEAAALLDLLFKAAVATTVVTTAVVGGVAIGDAINDYQQTKAQDKTKAIPITAAKDVSKEEEKKKQQHRGRIQVQGSDMKPEISEPWAQSQPYTAAAALVALESLKARCNKTQLENRKMAFPRAQRFITGCQTSGGTGPVRPPSFQNYPLPDDAPDARVDIEVHAGRAFV